MAIEIAAKPKLKIPRWTTVIFAFCLLLVLLGAAGYFYIDLSSKKISKEIEEKKIKLQATEEEKKLEQEVLSKEQKINTFSFLLDRHQKPVKLFLFLEENTHPRVWFSNFNFNSAKAEVTVSGQAADFVALGQQIMIFRSQPILKDVTLAKIARSETEEGRNVEFSFVLAFNPDILIKE